MQLQKFVLFYVINNIKFPIYETGEGNCWIITGTTVNYFSEDDIIFKINYNELILEFRHLLVNFFIIYDFLNTERQINIRLVNIKILTTVTL